MTNIEYTDLCPHCGGCHVYQAPTCVETEQRRRKLPPTPSPEPAEKRDE
jgi:hypothetical protein